MVTSAEESILSETRNQRIVAKLLKKRFWVKKSLLILTIRSIFRAEHVEKKKTKEIHPGILFLGLGFQEFWLSSSVCLFVCLFVAASSCVL
jgi:hypothetical protein